MCKGCVVREDCLEFALQNGEKFGIWGGLSESLNGVASDASVHWNAAKRDDSQTA